MDPVALAQAQTLTLLFAALSAESTLTPGRQVEAKLLSLAPDGVATAVIDGAKVSLQLSGPQAQRIAPEPGTILVLRIDTPVKDGAGPRATLIEVRPPLDAAAPSAAIGSPTTSLGDNSEPAVAARSAIASTPAAPQPRNGQAPAADITISPRAIVGQLLGPALARQDSVAPLYANLAAIVRDPASLTLPKPLLALVQQVLGQAIPVEQRPLTGPALKQAVAQSGVFLEAKRARAVDTKAPDATPIDLKANLKALREVLLPLAGPEPARAQPRNAAPEARAAPQEQQSQPSSPPRPAPPRHDGPLAPQALADATISALQSPRAIAETLLDQTEAALDRVTLSQFASLPLEGQRADQTQQRWLTEIPLAFQNGTAVLPLQIEREPPRRSPAGAEAPLWRMRFALDVEPLGPLQGVVTLQGRNVGVSLWAEREETSGMLRQAAPGLQASLTDAAFEGGDIDIRTGRPRVVQPTAGQFLDRMS